MKKLHGKRVVAYAQKRKRHNKEGHFERTHSPIKGLLELLIPKGYPEHSLHRRF